MRKMKIRVCSIKQGSEWTVGFVSGRRHLGLPERVLERLVSIEIDGVRGVVLDGGKREFVRTP